MTKLLAVAAAATLILTACASADKPRVAQAAEPACTPPPKELAVKDLAPGNGDDTVRFRTAVLVSYTGWLYDPCKPDHKGEKFDSSEDRHVPFSFMAGAGRVIKGWDEGVIGMKVQGRRLLVIPPDKAYGDKAVGPVIKPNSTLVFEVELLRIIMHADAPGTGGVVIPPPPK